MSTGTESSERGSTQHVHQISGQPCCLLTWLDDFENDPEFREDFLSIIRFMLGKDD